MKKVLAGLGALVVVFGVYVFGANDFKWNKVKRSAVSAAIETAGLDAGPDKSMRASTDPRRDERAKEELGYTLGMQAYIYGIPSLRLEEFRYKASELAKLGARFRPGVGSGSGADGFQFNELSFIRILSTPEMKIGLTPNNDTMYGHVMYDVGQHPIVLTVPEIRDRYYSVQIVDANLSNVAYVGTRTTGSDAGTYVLVGPDWEGDLPVEVTPVRLPTNQGFLAIRIVVEGEADVQAVAAIQDQFSLLALPTYMDPAVTVAPVDVPKTDTSGELHPFRRIVDIAQENPPRSPQGRAIWESLSHIGMSLDAPFEPSEIDPAIKRGMERALSATADVIAWKVKFRGYKSRSNWNVDLVGGSYGQDYLARAEGAIQGLIVHDPEEAMYFHTYHDSDGVILNGDRSYTMHFGAGQLPPVAGFWSIAAYDDEYNLVENPIRRYSIGDRTEGLTYNADGSLTLYIQSDVPEEGRSNWLPTPDGDVFRLNFRMYMPDAVMRDPDALEDYLPPLVKRD